MKKIKNNKGFSLVELIIVVAIMAVIIGVLAPQYLKYVEKSKVSADNDSIDALRKACETAVADPDSAITSDFSATITGGTAGVTISDSTASTEVSALMSGANDLSTLKLKSKTYNGKTVTIQVTFKADASGVMVPSTTVTGQVK